MKTSFKICVIAMAVSVTSASADAAGLGKFWKGVKYLAGQAFGESAEAAGKKATKLAVRQADDVARATVRHSDEAVRLVSRFGDDAAEAAQHVSPQSGRRLLMLADELEASGKAPEVMKLISEGGRADQVVEFLYRHKGAIAGGAVLTTLLTSPDAVLGAGADLVVGLSDVAGTTIAKPLIQEAGDALAPVVPQLVTNMMWAVFAVVLIGLVVICHRHRQNVKTLKKESDVYAGVAELKAESKPTLLSRLKLWQHK